MKNAIQIYGIQCRFGQLITFERTAAREFFVYAVSGTVRARNVRKARHESDEKNS